MPRTRSPYPRALGIFGRFFATRSAARDDHVMDALTWSEIREQHPSSWVCLVDVKHDPDTTITGAQVVGHARSMREALKVDAHAVVVHTEMRRVRLPR